MTEKLTDGEKADKSTGADASKSAKPRKSKSKNSRAKKSASAKKGAGGRPPWQPSIDDRVAVEQMKFTGESDAMIARALKVDVDTLRKHCAYELENGWANQRLKITKLLFESAEKGNASAIKKLDEMGRVAGAARRLGERGSKPAEPEQKPAPPAGKKEQAQQAAAQVTGKFAAPAPPRLAVDNTKAS